VVPSLRTRVACGCGFYVLLGLRNLWLIFAAVRRGQPDFTAHTSASFVA
jgi:hypothetical protein